MYPLKRATTPFGDDKIQELSHFAYIKYLLNIYEKHYMYYKNVDMCNERQTLCGK